MIFAWPAPTGDAEMVIAFDQQRKHRLLILPALFDEANKLRHQTIAVMRQLDAIHIDSLAPLEEQSLSSWNKATKVAATYFRATHILAIRGGALLVPDKLPGWRYAPVSGKSILRQLVRGRLILSAEAGLQEKSAPIISQGLHEGLELAGYSLGSKMVSQLAESKLPSPLQLRDIDQTSLKGPALWLRAEPDFEAHQAEVLASIITTGLKE